MHPTAKKPGYIIAAEPGQVIASDWQVSIVEADRIMNALLITADEAADRYRAFHTVVRDIPKNQRDDQDPEHLLRRFIRGEQPVDQPGKLTGRPRRELAAQTYARATELDTGEWSSDSNGESGSE